MRSRNLESFPARKGGSAFASAFKAEVLKSKHGAPMRLAITLALPFPLLALHVALNAPQFGIQYSLWNYWYALLMPISISLVAATVANADARMGNRGMLSCGIPLSYVWGAKVAWCLALSLLSNLTVFIVYAAASLAAPEGSAGMLPMLETALVLTVASSWMVPATLLLTMRAGMLAGAFVPLFMQLGLSFGWSAIPFWPLVPPTATIVLPTAFLPVLPSGEPASVGMALVESMGQGGVVALALVTACALTAALATAGAMWISRSEELR